MSLPRLGLFCSHVTASNLAFATRARDPPALATLSTRAPLEVAPLGRAPLRLPSLAPLAAGAAGTAGTAGAVGHTPALAPEPPTPPPSPCGPAMRPECEASSSCLADAEALLRASSGRESLPLSPDDHKYAHAMASMYGFHI